MHGQVFEEFNLLIYWFQKSDITYPTLEMIKICPKRRLFNGKNNVFSTGFGFRNSSGGGLHSNSNLDEDRLVQGSRRLGRCREKPGPHLNESRPDRAEGNLYVQGSKYRRAEGALYVQSTCLDVQRILWTVKLWRNSIY